MIIRNHPLVAHSYDIIAAADRAYAAGEIDEIERDKIIKSEQKFIHSRGGYNE